MKQKVLYAIVGVAAVVLVAALAVGLHVSSRVAQSAGAGGAAASSPEVDWHLMLLVNDSEDAYKEDFLKGVQEAAAKYKVAYEVVKVDSTNYEENLLDAFDMAVYAGVDGIVVDAVPSTRLAAKISQAKEKGIPVFTMNVDLPESGREAFVGIGRQVVGLLAATLFEGIFSGPADIAITLQSMDIALVDSLGYKDPLVAGFEERIGEDGRLDLKTVSYTERGVLSAESVATALVYSYPDIDGIFCDNGKNTLGVIQVMLEKNLVNQVALIGSGNEEEILEYIQKGGIIEASIITDYRDLGYNVVKAFSGFKAGEPLPDHITTNVRVVDEDNVEDYINDLKREREQDK